MKLHDLMGGLSLMLFVSISGCSGVAVNTAEKADDKVRDSIEVFTDLGESTIPSSLLKSVRAILVIPQIKKQAILGGKESGIGILSKRLDNNEWSYPVFISVFGASAGLQLGVKSTDLVLLINDYSSIDDILSRKFTLGVGTGVTAGPVGADAKVDTNAKIYSYSRSSGLYLGVSLEGMMLSVDGEVNETFYGKKNVRAADILAGKVKTATPSASVEEFHKELNRALQK